MTPPGETVSFTIEEDPGDRFDRFLATRLDISRTQAARLVALKHVRVNGEPVRRSYRASPGDRVDVRFPQDEQRRPITPHDVPLDCVYEDDSLLVINKPAGMVVHPAPGHWQNTLLNALVARGVQLSTGADGGRPGIVHRLDKDTSGLLLVAKNDDIHRALSKDLARRAIRRSYAALVWGHLGESITVDAPLKRHIRDRKRIVVSNSGREARSHATPLARYDLCDLVRVRLETGRTHQIRVHMMHIGHPVVGDPTYGAGGPRRMTGNQRPAASRIDKLASRQALHAAQLAFMHPVTGEAMDLRSDWPDDLRALLAEVAPDDGLLDRPNLLEYLGFFGPDEAS